MIKAYQICNNVKKREIKEMDKHRKKLDEYYASKDEMYAEMLRQYEKCIL